MISIPFSGSKKYSYKQVKQIAEEYRYKKAYELFGGSCVLSVNLLNDKLVDQAIVNDYDHFFDNYEQYLDYKDIVVSEGYKQGLVKSYHSGRHGSYCYDTEGNMIKLPSQTLYGKDREIIQNIISENVPQEYWRYLVLGTNFNHSGVYNHESIVLEDFTMFGNYLETDKQRYYLEVFNKCEINSLDYKDFIKKYINDFDNNSLIIADPPYYDTCQLQYEHTFTEQQTTELIELLQVLPCDYIFFNRNLSKIQEWFKDIDCRIERTGRAKSTLYHSAEEYLVFVRKDNIFFKD